VVLMVMVVILLGMMIFQWGDQYINQHMIDLQLGELLHHKDNNNKKMIRILY
jgi:hypothetical protein